jgi:hypothetical protein
MSAFKSTDWQRIEDDLGQVYFERKSFSKTVPEFTLGGFIEPDGMLRRADVLIWRAGWFKKTESKIPGDWDAAIYGAPQILSTT